jgi:ATP-binding cassette, subfamily B, bacterial
VRRRLRAIAAMVRMAVDADWRRLLIGAILRPASQFLFVPILGVMMRLIIDGALHHDDTRVIVAAAIFAAYSSLGLIFALIAFGVQMTLREKIDLILDGRLIAMTGAVPTLHPFEQPEYLDRLELLRSDRGSVGSGSSTLIDLLGMGMGLTLSVLLLASVHPALCLLALFAAPPLWASARSQTRMEAVMREQAEPTRRVLHLFDMSVDPSAGKELRVFGLGSEMRRRHYELRADVDDTKNRATVRMALLPAVGWLSFVLGYIGAIALSVDMAVHGHATPGEVFMVITVAGNINGQVQFLVYMLMNMFRSIEAVSRYLWLTERAGQLAEVHPTVNAPDRLEDGIRLDGVGFQYGESDTDVLTDVDLVLPAGATVALVGDNGAGKSTLVKLLCGLYRPTSGQILIDGRPLSEMDPAEWRERIAAGFQDFARFELLAGENVGLGDLPFIDDEPRVRTALSRAGIDEIEDMLPEGLPTPLGATLDGADLSVGQWQRLALGRAMMRSGPLLLVLDEPTASLDAEIEHALFERYADAARRNRETGAITLLVSHRFSTVRNADLIIVLAGGRVAESGSHDDLVAANGLYAELYDLQARSYR